MNAFCTIDDYATVSARRSAKISAYDDDWGAWDSANGRTTKFPYVTCAGGEYKRVFLRNGTYCHESQRDGVRHYVPYDPQPNEADVIMLCRYYCTQKNNDSHKKRVSWLIDCTQCVRAVAVVEYVGEPNADMPSHGNSKHKQTGYMRTPAHTMEHISDKVSATSCKLVYDEEVESMDMLDAPRDSRVVRNKKYACKSRESNSTFRSNFFRRNGQSVQWCLTTIFFKL